MTTRRKFLKMLGLAPVAAAATATVVKSAIAAPGTTTIVGIKGNGVVNGLPFDIKNGKTYLNNTMLNSKGSMHFDADGTMHVMDSNGVERVTMGRLK